MSTNIRYLSTGQSRYGALFRKTVLHQYYGIRTRRRTRLSGPKQFAVAMSPRHSACCARAARQVRGPSCAMARHSSDHGSRWLPTASRTIFWGMCRPSPDLNPVEMFWAWLRKKLRLMDLADLHKKRRPLGKPAYILRVKSVTRTQKAQSVGKNCALQVRKACQQVVDRKGAASDN